MVAITFNAQDFDPDTGGQSVFETGEYGFMITSSELKPTAKGGTMLVMDAKCQDPDQAGKKITIRLNVQNASAEAQDIAFRQLSAICHITGVLNMTDTQQLHGRPFRMLLEKTQYQKNNGDMADTNEIKAYLDVNGNPPSKGVAGGSGGGAAAPSAPSAPAAPAAQPAPAPAAQPAPAPAPAANPAPAPAPAENPAPAPAPAAPAPAPQPTQPQVGAAPVAPWQQ